MYICLSLWTIIQCLIVCKDQKSNSLAILLSKLQNALYDGQTLSLATPCKIVKIQASLVWYHDKIWLVTYEFSRKIWTSCGYKIINVLKVASWNFLLLSPEHNLNFYIKCCTNRSMVRELKFSTDVQKLLYSPSMPQDSIAPTTSIIIQIWKKEYE